MPAEGAAELDACPDNDAVRARGDIVTFSLTATVVLICGLDGWLVALLLLYVEEITIDL